MAPHRGGRPAFWPPPLLLAAALLLIVSSAKAGRLDAEVWGTGASGPRLRESEGSQPGRA